MPLHDGARRLVEAAYRGEPDGGHFRGQCFGADHQDRVPTVELFGEQPSRALRARDHVTRGGREAKRGEVIGYLGCRAACVVGDVQLARPAGGRQ
ncbi:Uncharacterised protein [Mycobacteroides abscessus]|nr:Uncharacterised protein [Mycobacteroides abscessus]